MDPLLIAILVALAVSTATTAGALAASLIIAATSDHSEGPPALRL